MKNSCGKEHELVNTIPQKTNPDQVEFLKVINRYSMCLSTPEHVVYQHIDNSTNSNKLSYKTKKK
jgi:hypothetical protein